MFKEEIPLNHFVELPEELTELNYSNMLCGVIRGALEMVRPRARGAAIAPPVLCRDEGPPHRQE